MNESLNLLAIAGHYQDRLLLFPALELFDSLNGRNVEGIGAKTIEGVGTKSDDAAAGDRVSDSGKSFIFLGNDHGATSEAPSGAGCL